MQKKQTKELIQDPNYEDYRNRLLLDRERHISNLWKQNISFLKGFIVGVLIYQVSKALYVLFMLLIIFMFK